MDAACELALAIRDSGAFDGVHRCRSAAWAADPASAGMAARPAYLWDTEWPMLCHGTAECGRLTGMMAVVG